MWDCPPAWRGLLAAGAGKAGDVPQFWVSWQGLPGMSSALGSLWLVCPDKVDQRKTAFIYMCVCACLYFIYIYVYIYIYTHNLKKKRILS